MADSAEANLMPPPPPQPEHGAVLEGQPDHGPQSQPGPNKQDLARQIQSFHENSLKNLLVNFGLMAADESLSAPPLNTAGLMRMVETPLITSQQRTPQTPLALVQSSQGHFNMELEGMAQPEGHAEAQGSHIVLSEPAQQWLNSFRNFLESEEHLTLTQQPIDNRTVPDRMVMAQRLIGDMLQTLKFSPHEIQRRMKAAYADKYGQIVYRDLLLFLESQGESPPQPIDQVDDTWVLQGPLQLQSQHAASIQSPPQQAMAQGGGGGAMPIPFPGNLMSAGNRGRPRKKSRSEGPNYHFIEGLRNFLSMHFEASTGKALADSTIQRRVSDATRVLGNRNASTMTVQEVTKLREQFETIPDRNLVNAMRSLETYIQYLDSKVSQKRPRDEGEEAEEDERRGGPSGDRGDDSASDDDDDDDGDDGDEGGKNKRTRDTPFSRICKGFIYWLKHQRPGGFSSHTTAYKYVEAVRKMIDRLDAKKSSQLADERELRNLILNRAQELRNNLPPVRPRCRDRAAFERVHEYFSLPSHQRAEHPAIVQPPQQQAQQQQQQPQQPPEMPIISHAGMAQTNLPSHTSVLPMPMLPQPGLEQQGQHAQPEQHLPQHHMGQHEPHMQEVHAPHAQQQQQQEAEHMPTEHDHQTTPPASAPGPNTMSL